MTYQLSRQSASSAPKQDDKPERLQPFWKYEDLSVLDVLLQGEYSDYRSLGE